MFFFQAEDGIRDDLVTGVQTCALPIAGAGVGALAFLTGCDIIDGPPVENELRIVSRFNDRVPAWLFNTNRLAPTYLATSITRTFPLNASYREQHAPYSADDQSNLTIH